MLVTDASTVVLLLMDRTGPGESLVARLRGQVLAAPELLDLEVTSALRRFVLRGTLTAEQAARALADLVALPARRVSHRPLLRRCWELRDSVSPYDACYVALAEALGATLLTADAALSRAPGLRCEVDLIG